MSKHPTEKRSDVEGDVYAMPESDVAAWVDRERKRRQAWLAGPSEDEKKAWARAERRRRQRDDAEESVLDEIEDDLAEARHILTRLHRNASPGLMVLASMLLEAPYRTVGARRRRVGMDDED